MPQNEAVARSYSHPAPYDGWNARGNLSNMKPTEAVQMDNIIPGVQQTYIRLGCLDWATGAPANITSLLTYASGTTNKIFASTDAGIYDVTVGGAIGAAAVACTNGRWVSINYTNSAGTAFLFAVNGVDSAKTYDGASWAVPAITVATSADWVHCWAHKHRIWAVEKNTMNLWYLPTDAIAGAAVKYPVGALFRKGGSLIAGGTWTIDGGAGVDDLMVIVTSRGEMAIYQGTDPASSASWALVGVFDVGEPVGNNPFVKFGGDLIYLSVTGLVPMSAMLQSPTLERTSLISYNIDGAFTDATGLYGNNFGWSMITFEHASLLIVNIPVSQDTLAYQFVMNTITKKWCRFTGWNATCWAEIGGDLYYAGGTTVTKAWSTLTDNGAPITISCYQAYAALGAYHQKSISLVRPNFGMAGATTIIAALDADFKTFQGQTQFTYVPDVGGAVWDVDLWDTGLWDSGISLWEPRWTTIPNDLGYLHSFRLQVTTSNGNFVWTSTDFAIRGAGIL
jgi:hypothetical protein